MTEYIEFKPLTEITREEYEQLMRIVEEAKWLLRYYRGTDVDFYELSKDVEAWEEMEK